MSRSGHLTGNGAIPTRRRWRISRADAATYLVLGMASFIAVAPIVYLLATAFAAETTVRTVDLSVLLRPSVDNYAKVLGGTSYGRWMINSLIVTTTTTLLILLMDSMAGFAFAKMRFRGRDALFYLLLATLMIPAAVTLLPLFLIVDRVGLTDTYLALVLPYLANPVGVFLMRQFIQTIPDELLDAARIDGLGNFLIFRRIILPLSIPALAVLGFFTFMTHWASLLWPLIITSSDASRTVPPGLATWPGQFTTNWGLVAAGGVLSIVPVLLVFLIFQRYLTQGLAGGRAGKA